MISTSNFQVAINILNRLTSSNGVNGQQVMFEETSDNQRPITTALKILNKVALDGTDEQKAQLSISRDNIISLNALLRKDSFSAEVFNKLGIKVDEEFATIKGIQIALPQTKFEKMVEIATKIPRIIFAILLDVLLLPGALSLLLVACCKSDFDPKTEAIKYEKTPILLLHGSGFNQTEWIVGRQFLKKEHYGSVFSLNYDGLVSNDPKKGIEDYAQDKISEKVKKIKTLTGSNRVILIGHSMGGMIAGYYAEYCSKQDQVNIEHVISIATPWQGTPMIDCFWKLGGCFSKERETKRYQQMSVSGGTNTVPNFRQTLVSKALASEREGVRKYYNIWSTTDYAVPGARGNLTEDPRRQRSFSYLGHHALVAWPNVWLQARSWLNEIYASESALSAKAVEPLKCG
jgi:pimeloyl-ACP methyl ester carboxylesterase